jgi:hypothetical protein
VGAVLPAATAEEVPPPPPAVAPDVLPVSEPKRVRLDTDAEPATVAPDAAAAAADEQDTATESAGGGGGGDADDVGGLEAAPDEYEGDGLYGPEPTPYYEKVPGCRDCEIGACRSAVCASLISSLISFVCVSRHVSDQSASRELHLSACVVVPRSRLALLHPAARLGTDARRGHAGDCGDG